MNRLQDSQSATEKVLDFPAKAGSFSDFPVDDSDPKMAEKDPHNPEKPDPVRSGKEGQKS